MESMDQKIRAVREYLAGQFPENNVEAYQDGGDAGPFIFRVDHGRTGAALHRAVALCPVLEDQTLDQLLDYLAFWDLPARLREAGLRPVVVTREGLQVEGQPRRYISSPR